MKVIVVDNHINNTLDIYCDGLYYCYDFKEDVLEIMFSIEQENFIEAFKEKYYLFEIEADSLSMNNIFKELPELFL